MHGCQILGAECLLGLFFISIYATNRSLQPCTLTTYGRTEPADMSPTTNYPPRASRVNAAASILAPSQASFICCALSLQHRAAQTTTASAALPKYWDRSKSWRKLSDYYPPLHSHCPPYLTVPRMVSLRCSEHKYSAISQAQLAKTAAPTMVLSPDLQCLTQQNTEKRAIVDLITFDVLPWHCRRG